MNKILSLLLDLFKFELKNLYLLSPIFLAIGIIIFFSLRYDPTISVGMLILPILIIIFLNHKFYLLNRLLIIAVIINLGFLAGVIRVNIVKAPQITKTLEFVKLEGTIAQIIDSQSTRKLLLDNLEIESLDPNHTPKFVRISVKSNISSLAIGDRLSFMATLMPPPHPSYPNGFNFAEYAYFKQIGAIGFAQSKLKLISDNDIDTFQKNINSIRKNIAKRIIKILPSSSASIALALLIGDSSKINTFDYSIIRTSGIAHIIAISGMHVVIIVGLIFLSVRGLLSNIEWLVSRYDLKKISAVLSIFGSLIYLIIAGHPISAQRAFIMSTITLMAIILDRSANPMRSIATAAIIVLLISPENLFTPSLQMSFAASVALITAFTSFSNFFKVKSQNLFRKIYIYFVTVILSTLIAGAATTPFVIYHFNQFSTYSLLTNLIAIPLTNFLIMPLGVASLLLMTIHLEFTTLIPMSWSINAMLAWSEYVSSLPHASVYLPSYTSLGIGLIGLGGLMLCIMTTPLRYLGILILMAGLLTNTSYFITDKPDIMLEASGKLFALKVDNNYYFSNRARARFVRSSWCQRYGINSNLIIKDLDACINGVCTIKLNNNKVRLIYDSKFNGCENDELTIDIFNSTQTCSPSNLVINKEFLKTHGNTFVWLEPGRTIIKSVDDYLLPRIWNHRNY